MLFPFGSYTSKIGEEEVLLFLLYIQTNCLCEKGKVYLLKKTHKSGQTFSLLHAVVFSSGK